MMSHIAKNLVRHLVSICAITAASCQQQMADQPSYRPDEASAFFPDGRADRPTVPGTIARGHSQSDHHMYTGRRSGQSNEWTLPATVIGIAGGQAINFLSFMAIEEGDFVDRFPFPVTYEILKRGQNRYMIYCAPCHDALGTGHGKIVERGYTPPPSYHIERLRQVPVGHIFAVITDGYGSMPDYRQQIPPTDRWAITAYIRALQLSQHFPEKQLAAPTTRETAALVRDSRPNDRASRARGGKFQ
jgi:hypothetical protein